MNVLILKLGATGDVLRTTPLLHKLDGRVSWVTAAKNVPLLQGLGREVRCVSWEARRELCGPAYDLVINLEDTLEVGSFLNELKFRRLFGAFAGANQDLRYTDDARAWFDLSLISRFGRQEADRLKLQNRLTYQEMLFRGLGFEFGGELYVLPQPRRTELVGDVAIAPEAGPVWPMKNWAYYQELKVELENAGLRVNLLPLRASLLEHLGDVSQHRCLVGGDSLPMHMALGSGTRCVSLFTCTSPWEIYDYSLQKKLISPLLAEFFYKRHFEPRATTAITLEQVRQAVFAQLGMQQPGEGRALAQNLAT